MELNDKQQRMCEESKWDFSDLKALFLNCALKFSPEQSHTQGLIDISRAIMEANEVSIEVLRPVDRDFSYGVYPDMKAHGGIVVTCSMYFCMNPADRRECDGGPFWTG